MALVLFKFESVPEKTRTKVIEDKNSAGSIGLTDIRKGVAFVNSVGGLDNVIAFLQILNVAREVQ